MEHTHMPLPILSDLSPKVIQLHNTLLALQHLPSALVAIGQHIQHIRLDRDIMHIQPQHLIVQCNKPVPRTPLASLTTGALNLNQKASGSEQQQVGKSR